MKRNWILVGAVAAMLAGTTGLRAQDNTSGSTSTSTSTTPSGTTTSTTDTTTTGTGMTTGTGTDTSGGMSSGSMPGGMMSGATMDYTMLNNKSFDYVDLMSATARGLNEDEVATVAKIADKTGMPFRDIADAVLRGETFSKLADMYNLKLADVMDVNDEKTKVASYKMTYENTGWKNVGAMGMMNSGMSDSSGSMSNMAPGTSGMTDMGASGTTGTGTTGSTDTTNSTSTTTTTTGQ